MFGEGFTEGHQASNKICPFKSVKGEQIVQTSDICFGITKDERKLCHREYACFGVAKDQAGLCWLWTTKGLSEIEETYTTPLVSRKTKMPFNGLINYVYRTSGIDVIPYKDVQRHSFLELLSSRYLQRAPPSKLRGLTYLRMPWAHIKGSCNECYINYFHVHNNILKEFDKREKRINSALIPGSLYHV